MGSLTSAELGEKVRTPRMLMPMAQSKAMDRMTQKVLRGAVKRTAALLSWEPRQEGKNRS